MRKTLAQIERILKTDIKWAITEGPGFDGMSGACLEFNTELPVVGGVKRIPIRFKDGPSCGGVCAIGAFCAHRQPKIVKLDSHDENVSSAAVALGKDPRWVSSLYQAVSDFDEGRYESLTEAIRHNPSNRSAKAMAQRLVRYAHRVETNWDKKQEAIQASAATPQTSAAS